MSPEEILELQTQQQQGQQPEMIPGSMEPSYGIPAHESHLIHAEIEVPEFNPRTGQRLSAPKVQTYYPDEFKKIEKNGGFKEYTVKIIHDPNVKRSQPEQNQEAHNYGKDAQESIKLRTEYKILFDNEADEDLSNDDLLELIELKKAEKEKPENDGKEKLNPLAPEVKLTPKQVLQARYKELYNEDPKEELTKSDLEDMIKAKESGPAN